MTPGGLLIQAWSSYRAWAMRTARRLHADPESDDTASGRWPNAVQTVVWDLLPSADAPRRDGVVAPTWSVPEWTEIATDDELDLLLAVEQRRLESAIAAAATTEGKASRLLTTVVTVLTASVALTALQLRASAHAGEYPWRVVLALAAAPSASACVLLLLAAVRSLDADTRVGIYGVITAADQVTGGKRMLLKKTTLAASTAEWTARKKATSLMYARAWFTRALAAVLIGLLLASLTIGIRG